MKPLTFSSTSAGRGERVVVTGIGMVTSVGHDAVMAPAAIRAGVSRFRQIPEFVAVGGDAASGGLVRGITDDRSGNDRLLSMAVLAAQEALVTAEEFYEDLDLPRGTLFLALAPPERPVFEEFGQEELRMLLESAQAEEIGSVEVIRDGHAGGAIAVARAATLLQEGKASVCIVGGIDSLVENPTLEWLDEAGRLKTDGRPHGFIPGEAAAFLILESASAAGRRGAPVFCEIAGAGYSVEDATILSDKPLFGRGLEESIRMILEGGSLRPEKFDGIFCDLNGEHYRMKEWGLAQCRLFDGDGPLPELWHPAENVGDVGAASAAVGAALAAVGIAGGHFRGPNILVWASSDAGGRGSILLSAPADRGKGTGAG